MSSCAICGNNAGVAINSLVSTRRVRPRVQKCSRSLLFCKGCFEASRRIPDPEVVSNVFAALYEAYTGISEASSDDRGGAA
jgi:hypothetical protein